MTEPKVLFFTLQIFVLVLSISSISIQDLKIAHGRSLSTEYHATCSEGNLINFGYRLLSSGIQIYSKTVDMRDRDDVMARSMERIICSNENSRNWLFDKNRKLTKQHGYDANGLEDPIPLPEPYDLDNQVDKYHYEYGILSQEILYFNSLRSSCSIKNIYSFPLDYP